MDRGRTLAAAQSSRLFFNLLVASFLAVALALALSMPVAAQDTDTDTNTDTDNAEATETRAPEEYTFDDGYSAYQRGNFYEARLIWENLADQGDARALYNLGTLHAEGRGVPANLVSARDFWMRAADAGHVRAMHNLALSLIADAGMSEDTDADTEYEQALHWLERASQGGFPNSQYTLGKMYQYGLSVEQNDQEAARLFMEAADQGFVNAQYNLGKLYRDGRGVPRDRERSLHYFSLAAEQGHAGAQNRLATRYARGEGVDQDDVVALVWASLAAEQGHERGIENRDVLLARMSDDQVAQAHAALEARRAVH